MQSAAVDFRLVLYVEIDVVIGHGDKEVTGRRSQSGPFMSFLAGERGLMSHVETNHRGAGTALEQVISGLGVLGDVRFGSGTYIARQRQRTAHQRNVDAGILQIRGITEHGGHGGHCAGGHDGQIRTAFACGGDDEIYCGARRLGLPGRIRQHCATNAVGVMNRNRTGAGCPWSIGLPSVLTALLPTTVCFGTFIRRGAAHQWQLRGCDGMVDAGIHRYVIASKCVEHRKRIARGQRHGDVAVCGSDANEIGVSGTA